MAGSTHILVLKARYQLSALNLPLFEIKSPENNLVYISYDFGGSENC
jgi:hypothetical protein